MSSSSMKSMKKLLEHEAHTDSKSLQRAMKEFQKAEKAHTKILQDVEKASKKLQVAVKEQLKTSKTLEKAQQKHTQAANELASAETSYKEKSESEASMFADIEQLQASLTDVYRARLHNDEDRERRLADLRKTSVPVASEHEIDGRTTEV
ncbi:hypothetical protein C8Q75DRAFT_802216 [Abortiporus biennis]|nr:hypothetical protein C8Q75DRAFT_802216 [Abortiporus biennis]